MLMHQQQQQQQENLYSPMMSRNPTLPSSSSWHPIHASPCEDMWELPASSSSMSDDTRDDFPTSGLHQEFSIYREDYSTSSNNHEQERRTPMPPTVTVRANHHRHNDHHRRESSRRLSNDDNSRHIRNSGIGLSEKKCVLGDATNTTLRRKNNNTSNTSRRIQTSYFN